MATTPLPPAAQEPPPERAARAGRIAARIAEADAARRRGDLSAAVTQLQAALHDEPEQLAIRLMLAWDLLRLDRPDEAEAACRVVLGARPSDPDPSWTVKRVLTKLGA